MKAFNRPQLRYRLALWSRNDGAIFNLGLKLSSAPFFVIEGTKEISPKLERLIYTFKTIYLLCTVSIGSYVKTHATSGFKAKELLNKYFDIIASVDWKALIWTAIWTCRRLRENVQSYGTDFGWSSVPSLTYVRRNINMQMVSHIKRRGSRYLHHSQI